MSDSFYLLTVEQYTDSGRRLYAYAKELSKLAEGSLVEKQKGEKTYYYLNQRYAGSVHSEYVGNSTKQAKEIRDELKKRSEIENEIHRLKEERSSIEHALSYKKWKKPFDYNFSLYFGNMLVADVFAGETDVTIKRYEKNPAMQLFYKDEINRFELGEILKSRCWDEDRDNLDLYLKKIGLDSYNPYEICRKTHGIKLQDAFWMKFVGESFDGTKVLRRYGYV